MVFARRNDCDVLVVENDMALAHLVEFKENRLSAKQQRSAAPALNQNYVHALELLLQTRLHPQKILWVLVAQGFSYRARNILQYTPTAFLKYIRNR